MPSLAPRIPHFVTSSSADEVLYLRVARGGPIAIKKDDDAWEKLDTLAELAASMGVSEKEAETALATFPPCDYAEADVGAYYGWWAWAAVDENGSGFYELMGGEWGEPRQDTFSGKDVDLGKLVLNEVVASCEEYCGLASEPKPRKREYNVKVLRAIGKVGAPIRRARPVPPERKPMPKKSTSRPSSKAKRAKRAKAAPKRRGQRTAANKAKSAGKRAR